MVSDDKFSVCVCIGRVDRVCVMCVDRVYMCVCV